MCNGSRSLLPAPVLLLDRGGRVAANSGVFGRFEGSSGRSLSSFSWRFMGFFQSRPRCFFFFLVEAACGCRGVSAASEVAFELSASSSPSAPGSAGSAVWDSGGGGAWAGGALAAGGVGVGSSSAAAALAAVAGGASTSLLWYSRRIASVSLSLSLRVCRSPVAPKSTYPPRWTTFGQPYGLLH